MKEIHVEAAFKFATQHSRISTVSVRKTKFWVNNPTHHYYSPYRPYRMKHDPFPILIHLGEREDYSGVSRGREIVLCCCVPSSRRASYILIHRTSAQRISPKRWTMDDWKSELHIHLRGPRNWGGNLALSHPFY